MLYGGSGAYGQRTRIHRSRQVLGLDTATEFADALSFGPRGLASLWLPASFLRNPRILQSDPSSSAAAQEQAPSSAVGTQGELDIIDTRAGRPSLWQSARQAISDPGNETVVTVSPPLPPQYYPQLLEKFLNESATARKGDVLLLKVRGQPNNGLCEVGELPTADSPGACFSLCLSLCDPSATLQARGPLSFFFCLNKEKKKKKTDREFVMLFS